MCCGGPGCGAGYAAKLIQYGWEVQTEALKHGGVTGMLDRLDNPSKLKCMELADELKDIMRPLYRKHQDDIISGAFSSGMMARVPTACDGTPAPSMCPPYRAHVVLYAPAARCQPSGAPAAAMERCA